MTCKGNCERFRARKPLGMGRYETGQKLCRICSVFIKHEGIFCPCCGCKLSNGPRSMLYKLKLRRARETKLLQIIK